MGYTRMVAALHERRHGEQDSAPHEQKRKRYTPGQGSSPPRRDEHEQVNEQAGNRHKPDLVAKRVVQQRSACHQCIEVSACTMFPLCLSSVIVSCSAHAHFDTVPGEVRAHCQQRLAPYVACCKRSPLLAQQRQHQMSVSHLAAYACDSELPGSLNQ
jgi:hypothetical protein